MKCFHTLKGALSALIVLWFEPDVELVQLNPELPIRLDSVDIGERVYIIGNAISLEQMQALATRSDIIWICNESALINEALGMDSRVCNTYKFIPSRTIEELTWSWFSEDLIPQSLFVSFIKPQFNCLEIPIPRSE